MTRPRASRVYFIRPIGMRGPIKIGYSQSPDRRRSSLETWSPFPLEIVAEIDGGPKLERKFHSLFREQHKSREWFEWSPDLQAIIDAIASGSFDIAALPDPIPFRRHVRDTSIFKSMEWRYAQSFTRRVDGFRRRGVGWDEVRRRAEAYFGDAQFFLTSWKFAELRGGEFEQACLRAEKFIEELHRDFPAARPPSCRSAKFVPHPLIGTQSRGMSPRTHVPAHPSASEN